MEECGGMCGDAPGARLQAMLVCRRVRKCSFGEESRGAAVLRSVCGLSRGGDPVVRSKEVLLWCRCLCNTESRSLSAVRTTEVLL